ncbi:MAG: hypothetical protein LC734_06275 [Acidobacteria bacterium]|nr:hypothetical protein [Acidobacteriota bacterium]
MSPDLGLMSSVSEFGRDSVKSTLMLSAGPAESGCLRFESRASVVKVGSTMR